MPRMPPPRRLPLKGRQLPDQRRTPPAPDINQPLENLMMDPEIMRLRAEHDLQVGMKAARQPPFDNRFVGEEAPPRGRTGLSHVSTIMRGRRGNQKRR